MENITVLLTFAAGLAAALVFGYLAVRVKLSPIVGYMLAGILVGPFTPGFVADSGMTDQFAEIGVILMLFGIGLRFELPELIAVWRVAVPGAVFKSALSTFALAGLLHLTGVAWTQAMILGMAVSVASTVVMVLVLSERHDLHAPIGHVAIGSAVVEDLMTVALLLLLPIIASSGADNGDVLVMFGNAGLKIIGLVAVVIALGKWVIPWMLNRVESTRSRELFTVAVLAMAIGIAAGSARLFGVSMALGAFLAGLAVGQSEFATRAAGDAVPMRDAFSVLFFVSIGMLFDPSILVQKPLMVSIVLGVVILFKPVATTLTLLMLGRPITMALPVGAAFAQIGEFSFILASVARSLGLIDGMAFNAIVAAAIVSITANPFIYRAARRTAGRIGSSGKHVPVAPAAEIDPLKCVLVGYGPVGQIVCRLLKERGNEVTVVDLNLNTVRRLKSGGIKALYGDVLRSGTLEDAGLATAGSLVLSADIEDAAEIIRKARKINPGLRILARCAHLRGVDELKKAGADVVAAGEAEVGVALAEEVTSGDDWDRMTAAEHREVIRKRLYDNPNGRFPTAIIDAEEVKRQILSGTPPETPAQ